MKRFTALALVTLVSLVCNGLARAGDNDGQADLDKAAEKKLSAKSLDDLAEVLKLCDSAVKQGLTTANKQFADALYTSTLNERATIYTEAIFQGASGGQLDPRWPQIREMALADLEKVVTRDPKVGDAYLKIAKLQALPRGDHDKALKAAEQAVELLKDDAAEYAAALVVRSGLQTDAVKKLSDLDEALKLTPNDAEALQTRAVTLLAQDKFEKALADLDVLAKAQPKNPGIQEVRGFVLFKLKRTDDGMKAFDKAIALEPGNAMPYIRRARVRADVKDTKGALEDLAAALRVDPDNGWALLSRARIYQTTGDLKAAKADVESALEKHPDLLERLEALDLRAIISAQAGDYNQAIQDLEQLAKVAPKNADLIYKLGLLYEMDKQSRKAIDKFTAALALLTAQDKMWQVYRSRGDCYLNLGQHAEAVADYEKAYKVEPEDSGLLNNFAWVLATSPNDKVRDGKRALEMATKACEKTDYKRPHILSTLAASYAETGDFENARKWSAKAVELASVKSADSEDEDTQPDVKESLEKELKNYKQGKPTRELLNEEEDAKKPKSKDGKKPEAAGDSSGSEKPAENPTKKPAEKPADDSSNESTAKKPDVGGPDKPQQK